MRTIALFDFLRFSKRQSAVVSLDIGTEFVKALIFEIDEKGNKGKILGVGKSRQRLGDIQFGAVMDIGSVVENCRNAIEEAQNEAKVYPNQMIMGIAGELVKGMTLSYNYKRDNPGEKINIEELKNIVHKVQWKAFDSIRKQIAKETGYPEIDIKLVNAAIVSVEIDGYKVSNPVGFQGKDVEISVFNSFAPLVHFGALETVAREFDYLDLLGIISQPYAVSRCMGFEEGGHFSGIFIDIGGGTTDIAVVHDGSIEGTKMFAIGGRTFTKRIATELNISFQKAETIKLAYSKEELDSKSMQEVRKIIENDVDVWLTGVELALSEFTHLDMMPSDIYLCGGGTYLKEVYEALISKKWIKNFVFSRPPVVKYMEPNDITSLKDETGKLKGQCMITPMALANVGLDLAGDDKPIQALLKKVIGIIKA